jgi:hypothetical protein
MIKDKHNFINELGWLLMWISLYGIIDSFIQVYLRTDKLRFLSFCLLGIVGIFIIFFIQIN